MPRRLALTAPALVLLGCAAVSPHLSKDEVVQRILPPTVRIAVERAGVRVRSASGVVIRAEADPARSFILTTQHALEGLEGAEIYVVPGGRGQPRRKATLLAADRKLDLALVRLDGLTLPAVSFGGEARLGDEVWVVAYPWGRRLSLVSGVVSQVDPVEGGEDLLGATVMIDASVSYGASGGGVFEAVNGRLIGMVEGYRTARMTLRGDPGSSVEFPVPGETYVVPAAAIRRFLQATGHGHLLAR